MSEEALFRLHQKELDELAISFQNVADNIDSCSTLTQLEGATHMAFVKYQKLENILRKMKNPPPDPNQLEVPL